MHNHARPSEGLPPRLSYTAPMCEDRTRILAMVQHRRSAGNRQARRSQLPAAAPQACPPPRPDGGFAPPGQAPGGIYAQETSPRQWHNGRPQRHCSVPSHAGPLHPSGRSMSHPTARNPGERSARREGRVRGVGRPYPARAAYGQGGAARTVLLAGIVSCRADTAMHAQTGGLPGASMRRLGPQRCDGGHQRPWLILSMTDVSPAQRGGTVGFCH